ncbi:EAL domain-containing protein [Clostridium perfringens]|uniref:EAL domain-containing protein n=2 Tax=Clostridium perfringens TaxID=1502 RepID=A0AAW9K3L5_CLOPF|nr:EAL domain-containing protein [Clostridium perfringens]MBI5988286.1 EAL domain-containing protein [Clostridium perfringens]MBI5994514.1 EAL domain-containing protein [Clostridium perfringens]MBI6000119.1 EAL domain-containing protein [Clostridium perfringens]MBI6001938.1 EAL domain-containing protein [Clostridium perfringens]MBI6062258.1 EAL domain-containing protein [Clostridium perfringens]
MKKRVFWVSIVFLIIITVLGITIKFDGKKVNCNRQTIKVGFYEYYPYYYLNKNSIPDGYYNELLEVISNKLNLNYEYVDCNVTNALEKLKSGQIDLVFGISKTPDREKEYEFTDHYLNNDNFAIYTNKNIKNGDLKALNGLKMGYLKGEENNEWILRFLNNKGINVNIKNVSNYLQDKEYLYNNKVDFVVENTRSNLNYENKNIKKIFEFSSGPVYIVSRKDNKKLIERIDSVLGDLEENEEQKDVNLYSKYFNEYLDKLKNEKLLIVIFLMIILAFIYKKRKDKIFAIRAKRKIRCYMKNDKYILYYQPIVDPKTDSVKGFESLLRLNKDGKNLTPYSFIREIEDNNMSLEVSLWLLKKVILDYRIIKDYDMVKGRDFYISLNVSFKEIENPKFLRSLMKIAKDYKIDDCNICLEIVEKFGMEDIGRIQSAIRIIKEYGFLIAIDDFGVEYSNLDLLNKIDSDIVKLDKYFADNLDKSIINEKTVEFISEICIIANRTIVFEGIEEQYQVDIVKAFPYEKIYIQGYFYSKPVDIETLKDFKFKDS